MAAGIFGTLATLRGAHVRGTQTGEAAERARLLEQFALERAQAQEARQREVQDRDHQFRVERAAVEDQDRVYERMTQQPKLPDFLYPTGTNDFAEHVARTRQIAQAQAGGRREGAPPVGRAGTRDASSGARGGRVGVITEGERRASALLQIAEDAARALDGAAPSVREQQVGRVPVLGNVLQGMVGGGDAQMREQAGRQLADAYLRLVSGANATEPEVQRTMATFIPVAGDKPATLKRKETARRTMLAAIRTAAGRGAAAAAPQGAGNPDAAAEIEALQAELNEALQAGADRDQALALFHEEVQRINRQHGVQR